MDEGARLFRGLTITNGALHNSDLEKMKSVWISIIIAAAFIYSGCTFENEYKSDIPIISLERSDSGSKNREVVSIAPAAEFHDSLFIEAIPSIDVDRHGNLYLAAERHRTRTVYQFSSNGVLQDTIGAFGDEPGEFESIRDIQISGDTLYVFDATLNRVNQFDISENRLVDVIEYERMTARIGGENVEFNPVPVWRWSSGDYLIELQDSRNPALNTDRLQIYRLGNSEGIVLKGELFELQTENFLIGDHAGRPSAFQLPYPERSLRTKLKNGVFYTAWTEEFKIEERDSTGSIQRVFTFPYKRVPLDADKMVRERYSHNRQLQLTRESADYPQEWPAIYSMFADDQGKLWVALIPENESIFEWWIIDPANEQEALQKTFNWSRSSLFQQASNGKVYAVESDASGFKKVVSYSY